MTVKLTRDEKWKLTRDIFQISCSLIISILSVALLFTGLHRIIQKVICVIIILSAIYIGIIASIQLGNTIRDINYRSIRA
jgi:hypothetical protein